MIARYVRQHLCRRDRQHHDPPMPRFWSWRRSPKLEGEHPSLVFNTAGARKGQSHMFYCDVDRVLDKYQPDCVASEEGRDD